MRGFSQAKRQDEAFFFAMDTGKGEMSWKRRIHISTVWQRDVDRYNYVCSTRLFIDTRTHSTDINLQYYYVIGDFEIVRCS